MNAEDERYWHEMADADEREMASMRQYYADWWRTTTLGWRDGSTTARSVAAGAISSILATDVAHLTDTPTLSLRGRANSADTKTTTGYGRTEPMTNDSSKKDISVSENEQKARDKFYASTLERDKRLESHALAANQEGDDEGCWMAMAARAENARFLAS